MSQVICGVKNSTGNTGLGATAGTVFLTGTQEHQSTSRAQLMPIPGTFRNFRVRQPVALGVGNQRFYRLRKATTVMLEATFDAADTGVKDGVGADAHYDYGDAIDLYIHWAGSNLQRLHQTTVEFVPDVPGQMLYGFHGQGASAAGYGCCPFMGERFYATLGAGGNATTDRQGKQINRVAQDLIAMTVQVDAGPGVGSSYALVWNVNGVDQDGTGGLPDTRLILSGTATTALITYAGTKLHLDVGDEVSVIVRTISGAPAMPNRFSVAFATEPDTEGAYAFHSQGLATSVASAGNIRYFLPSGGDYQDWAWTSTESDVYNIGNPGTDIQLLGMIIDLPVALDHVNEALTLRLRVEGSPVGDPIVLSGVGAIEGVVAFSEVVTIGIDDEWDLQLENTGSQGISTTSLDSIRVVLTPGFLTDPIVQTRAATGVRFDRATLRGRINPSEQAMVGWFEWGTDPDNLDNFTDAVDVGAGTSFVSISEVIEGLSRATTYYFRAVGSTYGSPGGSPDIYGDILSFTTLDEHVFVDGDVSHPLTMLSIIDREENRHVFAEVDLNDNLDYEGGYKYPEVLRWLEITRGFSDRTGQIEHMVFGAVLADNRNPRFWRGLLDSPTNRFLTNRPLWEKMIDDEDRRVEGLWRYVANGFVSDYEPQRNLTFLLTGCDWLKKKFSRKAKAARSWQPPITIEDFPNCPQENLNKAAQLIYGKVDDSDPQTVQVGTTAPYDGSIPNVNSAIAEDFHDLGDVNGLVTVIIVPIVGGAEGPVSNPAGTYDFDRAQVAYWNHQGTAASYAAYFFNGGWGDWTPQGGLRAGSPVTWVRRLTHDNSTMDGGAIRDFKVTLTSITDGTDALTGVATETVDQGHGEVKATYVGTYDVSGTLYHKGLISRGACEWIREGYHDGIAMNIGSDAAQAGVGGIWLIPGYAGWNAEFADPYEDINGRRYTVVYGKVGYPGPDRMAGIVATPTTPGAEPTEIAVGITWNIWGIEDVGDGTGATIESLPMQHMHFVRNFLAPDTAPGTDWLTTCPTFPHEPTLDLVDETSFFDVEDEWAELNPSGSPVGIIGAFVIGANGEFENALDVLADFHVSGDYNGTFTRKGQYKISIEPSAAPDDPFEIDDVISIVADSFEIRDEVSSEFFNILPYVHTEDYTGRVKSGWGSIAAGEADVRDTTSITNYDQERESPVFQLRMLRSYHAADAIEVVMERKKARYRHPLRTARFIAPLSLTEVEPGDAFRMTHIEGIGANGWEGRLVRCTRHGLDPNLNRVRLEVYDIEPLVE